MKTAKAKSTDSEARARIIETAGRLFYEQGYLATGINQVIAESKVAKNTFYYYFPSKDDLCLAYLKARYEFWGGWLQKEINSHKQPLKRVLAVFDFLEDWLKDCKYRGCAFINMSSEIPKTNSRIREQVIATQKGLHKLFEDLVSQLKKSEVKYKKIKVKETANMIYVLCEGAIVSCQSFGEIWPVEAARKNAKFILSGGN